MSNKLISWSTENARWEITYEDSGVLIAYETTNASDPLTGTWYSVSADQIVNNASVQGYLLIRHHNDYTLSGYYPQGESITTTNRSGEILFGLQGYSFSHWTLLSGNIAFDTAFPDNTFIMPAETVELSAFYIKTGYTVTVTGDNGTQGAYLTGGDTSYTIGDTVLLSATPDVGYQFTGWSSNDVTITTTPTGAYFTMPDGDVNVTANHAAIISRELLVTTSPSDGGEVVVTTQDGSVDYNPGELISLSAIPAEGYTLGQWHADIPVENWVDLPVSPNLAPPNILQQFYMPNADVVVEAYFREEPDFTNLESSYTFEMVRFAEDHFTMGSPAGEFGREEDEVQHQVAFAKPWFGCKYAVTQHMYNTIMSDNPSHWNDSVTGFSMSGHPVDSVTWQDAVDFCAALTTQEQDAGRLPVGWVYTLPTEAQWEYMCRGGQSTAYWDGDYPPNPNIGKFSGSSLSFTSAVDSELANQYGLYQVHGNVWEWCQDYYAEYFTEYVQEDPRGNPNFAAETNSPRVLRGGYYKSSDTNIRSANRYNLSPTTVSNKIGFRIVCNHASIVPIIAG